MYRDIDCIYFWSPITKDWPLSIIDGLCRLSSLEPKRCVLKFLQKAFQTEAFQQSNHAWRWFSGWGCIVLPLNQDNRFGCRGERGGFAQDSSRRYVNLYWPWPSWSNKNDPSRLSTDLLKKQGKKSDWEMCRQTAFSKRDISAKNVNPQKSVIQRSRK